jgi:hypothetical protein
VVMTGYLDPGASYVMVGGAVGLPPKWHQISLPKRG